MKVATTRKASVSFSKGSGATSLRHNNRDLTEKEKESQYHNHIDFSRTPENKTLVKEDIREKYDELFGEAVAEYNSKQKRKDRKIDDYYSKILHDKKLDTQKEFIVQVGRKEDFQDGKIENFWEISNDILEEYVQGFEERNPNLKIYNAVIHNDEATPHLHLNVIPVATGYERGVQVQPSFDKALRQQDGLKDSESSFDLFNNFRNQEVNVVSELLQERSIERELVGTNNIKDHHEYKELQRELEKMELEIEGKDELVSEIQLLQFSKNRLEKDVEALKKLKEEETVLREKVVSMKQELVEMHDDKNEMVATIRDEIVSEVKEELKPTFVQAEIAEQKVKAFGHENVESLLYKYQAEKNTNEQRGKLLERIKSSAEKINMMNFKAVASDIIKVATHKVSSLTPSWFKENVLEPKLQEFRSRAESKAAAKTAEKRETLTERMDRISRERELERANRPKPSLEREKEAMRRRWSDMER